MRKEIEKSCLSRLEEWRASLDSLASEQKASHLMRFFKTGKGQYGEGDIFLGLTVPQNRAVSKKFADAPLADVREMLMSPYHEYRLSALLVLVEQYRRARTAERRKEIVDFYLTHAQRANNWDLVDLSCEYILGKWLLDHPDRPMLMRLAESDCLWEQRIAIVTTLELVRNGRYDDALFLAEFFITHPHDLIHKATGWVLREVGKRDIGVLRSFLDRHAAAMPRTALRYSIEKMEPDERRHYMQQGKLNGRAK